MLSPGRDLGQKEREGDVLGIAVRENDGELAPYRVLSCKRELSNFSKTRGTRQLSDFGFAANETANDS